MNTRIFSLLATMLMFVACSKNDNEGQGPVSVTIELSAPNTIYNKEPITISATTSEAVSEIVFYFNGQNIGSSIISPYEVLYTPNNVTPGTHTITAIAKLNGSEYKEEQKCSLKLRLGDEFQGGKIFYLETSGEHGLIASLSDLKYSGDFGDEVRFAWGSETLLGTSLNNGKKNTELMAASASSAGSAGYHFKNGGYSLNGYSDWYIPSLEELELLQENKSYVGGFSTSTDWEAQYWSSSEKDATFAYILNFNALMGNTNNKIKVFKIRPIRSF